MSLPRVGYPDEDDDQRDGTEGTENITHFTGLEVPAAGSHPPGLRVPLVALPK